MPGREEPREREDHKEREHEARVEEPDDGPRHHMEEHELRERRPEDPRTTREQAEDQNGLQHHDVGAGGGYQCVRKPQELAPVERGAREPLRIELDRARPEVEEDDQVLDHPPLGREQEDGEGHEERHVVLVQAEPVVLDDDEDLHELQNQERQVRRWRRPATREQEQSGHRQGEVPPEEPVDPRGAEHPESMALLEERPADGHAVRREDAAERHSSLPVDERQDVNERESRPVDAEDRIGRDPLDVSASQPDEARHQPLAVEAGASLRPRFTSPASEGRERREGRPREG